MGIKGVGALTGGIGVCWYGGCEVDFDLEPQKICVFNPGYCTTHCMCPQHY